MKLRSVLQSQRKRISSSWVHTGKFPIPGLNRHDDRIKAPFGWWGGIALLLLLLASCHKESNSTQYTIPSGLSLISSGYVAGASARIEVYTAAAPFVGYNKVYIALYDSASNTRITDAQVSMSATLSGGSPGPVENPVLNASSGLFCGAVVFTSASGTPAWTLAVQVSGMAGGRSGGYSNAFAVVQPSPARSYSVNTADGANLFISIVQPNNPQLGVNDLELVVDRMVNAAGYAPDSTYMLAINPIMPSMTGMGSPNNVNPVYSGNGHYVGKVDFIMSGGWDIYVDLSRNGMVCDTTHYFALNL